MAFERDGNGRVVAETLNGRRVESRYDAACLRVERRIGEHLVKIERDPLGLVERLTVDGHRPLAFSHDRLGRETRRASAAGFALSQSHDAIGQLLTQSAGFTPETSSQHFGQAFGLDAVAGGSQASRGVERRFAWDKAFAPTVIDDGFWGITNYAHDANGQVTQTRNGDGSGECFRYDAAHNVEAFAEGAGGVSGEDGLGLIPAIAGLGWRPAEEGKGFIGWRLSEGGKVRLARGPQGERIHLRHDIRGRVIERRVERDGFRPKTWTYEWDAKDRLVRCRTPQGEAWRYGYDPFGRRVWKVRELTPGEARRHLVHVAGKVDLERVADPSQRLDDPREPAPIGRGKVRPGEYDEPPVVGVAYGWDGDNLIEEAPLRLDGAIAWDRAERWHYEPGSFRPLAKQEAPRFILDAEGHYDEQSGRLLYVVCDHLGTPREMFDEKGARQWAAEYRLWGGLNRLWRAELANDNGRSVYPSGRGGNTDTAIADGGRVYASYGNLALSQEKDFGEARAECPIRFQGQWEDAESGLYYNRFRYYDPLVAQYLCPDPIGLKGGVRPQGYVINPTIWIDPWGLEDKYIDPNSVRFSQDSAGENFKDGSSVDELIKNLQNGSVSASDLPPIRTFTDADGDLYTLDNRRLYAAQEAGIDGIKYQDATPEEIKNESWKMTTKNKGKSIRIRRKSC